MAVKQAKTKQKAQDSGAANASSVRLVAIICCEHVITDQNGSNSLISIFDNLKVRFSDPEKAMSRPFFLYVALEDVGDSEIQLQLRDPSGEMIIEGVMAPSPEAPFPESGKIVSIARLQFPTRQEGQYRFSLLADKREIGSTSIAVTLEEVQRGSGA